MSGAWRRATGILAAAACLLAAGPLRAQDDTATAAEIEAIADLAFGRESYEAAETAYRRVLELQPDNRNALNRLALMLSWKGEYPGSIALYQRLIALDPSGLEPRRGLAKVITWSEDYPRAIKLYRELLAERPADEGLSFELAQAQAWSGDFAGARDTLNGMLSRNPRNAKARALLGQVQLWDGRLEEAERQFRAVLSEDPDNAVALAGMGDVLAARGRHDEAAAFYDRALAIDPKNRAALKGKARVYRDQGRMPEALAAVREALELYPDARDARRLGRDIGGALRPSLQLFASTIQDTDHNDLSTWGAIYQHHVGDGRGQIGFALTHAQTDAQVDIDPATTTGATSATPVARYDTARLSGSWRFSRRLILYGEAGPERTTVPFPDPFDPGAASSFLLDPNGRSGDATHEHAAGSVTVEVNAADRVTFVGSVSQERLVGTTQAFMNDIGIRSATVTTILAPHPRLRIRLTGQKAVFTDDEDVDVDPGFNVLTDPGGDHERGRDLVAARASLRLPLRRPRLSVHWNLRWMAYEGSYEPGGGLIRHGYFAPAHYAHNTIGFDLSDTAGRHVYWGLGADTGIQVIDALPGTETGADPANRHNSTFSYRALAGLNIAESASLEGYYARSDSAVQSVAGFRSTEAGIRLRMRFGQSLGPALPDRDAATRKGDNASD